MSERPGKLRSHRREGSTLLTDDGGPMLSITLLQPGIRPHPPGADRCLRPSAVVVARAAG